jgi:hypothetical protein
MTIYLNEDTCNIQVLTPTSHKWQQWKNTKECLSAKPDVEQENTTGISDTLENF